MNDVSALRRSVPVSVSLDESESFGEEEVTGLRWAERRAVSTLAVQLCRLLEGA